MSKFTELVRVRTDHGSRIEPPLNPAWSKLKQLQWHAAVVRVDCGVDMEITKSDQSVWVLGAWIPQRGLFDYSYPGCTGGGYGFNDMWAFLNGVSAGVNAWKRVTA